MKKTKKYKSYYIPVSQRKVTKAPKKVAKKKAPKKVAKKKYKSYYKSKKQRELEAAQLVVTPPLKHEVQVVKKVVELPVKETIPSKRPVKYLNNKDLLAQVLLSKKQSKMTNELAKMLQLLTSRYAKKGNFASYTYNDDMQSYAMLMIVKTWHGFDPAKAQIRLHGLLNVLKIHSFNI